MNGFFNQNYYTSLLLKKINFNNLKIIHKTFKLIFLIKINLISNNRIYLR